MKIKITEKENAVKRREGKKIKVIRVKQSKSNNIKNRHLRSKRNIS